MSHPTRKPTPRLAGAAMAAAGCRLDARPGDHGSRARTAEVNRLRPSRRPHHGVDRHAGDRSSSAPAAPVILAPELAPGTAVVGTRRRSVSTPRVGIDPEVQVVRFQGPPGLVVEVLAPAPTPVPIGDGGGIITVGLKRGVGYRLRITNIPERAACRALSGHRSRRAPPSPRRHRPRQIPDSRRLQPGRPRRRRRSSAARHQGDLPGRSRPGHPVPHGQGPDFRPHAQSVRAATHVASTLGRPVAIVRIGGRQPTVEEIKAGSAGDLALDWVESIGTKPCPFLCHCGTRCRTALRASLASRTPPAARPALAPRRISLRWRRSRHPGRAGRRSAVSGIEPRDAVIRFDIGAGRSIPGPSPADQRRLRLCTAVRRGPHQQRDQPEHRHPNDQDRQDDRQVRRRPRRDRLASRLVQNQARRARPSTGPGVGG